MATNEHMGRFSIFSMKWSCTAAAVNRTRHGTCSIAFRTLWHFIPPFFFPCLGWRPAPLRMFENSVMVVESMIYSAFSHLRTTWRSDKTPR